MGVNLSRSRVALQGRLRRSQQVER